MGADPRPIQMTLFGADAASTKTRAITAANAIATGPSRRQQIVDHVGRCGGHGATRDEIAEAIGRPVHTITGPVMALVRSGRLVSTPQTRLTRYGFPAVVLVAAKRRAEG